MHNMHIISRLYEKLKGKHFARLRIGEIYSPEEIKSGLEALSEGRLKVEIETSPLVIRCRSCSYHGPADYPEHSPVKLKVVCPKCSSKNTELLSGDEVEILDEVL